MDFPERSKQKKSEDESLAILKYKLRKLGVFRDQRESDFGIDIEFEFEHEGKMIGKLAKAQIKSEQDLQPRKTDGVVTISGIKQATLAYWCEISHQLSVIVYAVDLKTETIYVIPNVFWQASALIDGGKKTKTLEFVKAKNKGDYEALAIAATFFASLQPNMTAYVGAHVSALRRIGEIIELQGDAFQYDAGTEVNEPVFKELLSSASVLLWRSGSDLWTDEKDKAHWGSYEYWKRKSERDKWDGLVCYTAKPILKTLLPALMKALELARDRVIAGKYYWSRKNPDYLKTVYSTVLPNFDLNDDKIEWGHEYRKLVDGSRTNDGDYFVAMARRPVVEKKDDADPKE